MRIIDIQATPLRIPRPQAFVSSLGSQDYTENAIVEIHTQGGIVGIGEASSIWGRKGRGAADDIRQRIAPALIGKDAFRIRGINATMSKLCDRSFPAKAAIDMALHDIVGKALETPIYNLLGGKVRDSLSLSHSLSMGPVDQVADQSETLVSAGYETLKIKIGQDHQADLETIEKVRERVGTKTTLRVDVNMGYSCAEDAVRNIKALEQFDLELVEQPLHYSDIDGLRYVRDHVEVPIMADESVWTPADALQCARAEAVDVLNVYVAEAGGLRPACDLFAIAQAAGLPCIIGSMPEFGVGTMAQAHLAFATGNLGFACDVNGCVYQSDDIIHETLDIRDGQLYAPPGPGLGVTLDREKMERYRV